MPVVRSYNGTRKPLLKPSCAQCGSEDLLLNSTELVWDMAKQMWVYEPDFSDSVTMCPTCGPITIVNWLFWIEP